MNGGPASRAAVLPGATHTHTMCQETIRHALLNDRTQVVLCDCRCVLLIVDSTVRFDCVDCRVVTPCAQHESMRDGAFTYDLSECIIDGFCDLLQQKFASG